MRLARVIDAVEEVIDRVVLGVALALLALFHVMTGGDRKDFWE